VIRARDLRSERCVVIVALYVINVSSLTFILLLKRRDNRAGRCWCALLVRAEDYGRGEESVIYDPARSVHFDPRSTPARKIVHRCGRHLSRRGRKGLLANSTGKATYRSYCPSIRLIDAESTGTEGWKDRFAIPRISLVTISREKFAASRRTDEREAAVRDRKIGARKSARVFGKLASRAEAREARRIRGGGCDRGTGCTGAHASVAAKEPENDGARACSLQLARVTRYVAVLPLRHAGRCASAYAPWPIVGRGGVYHVTRAANRTRA